MGVLKLNTKVILPHVPPFLGRTLGLGSSTLSVCLPPGEQSYQEGVSVLCSGSQSVFALHVNVFQMKGTLMFNVYICLRGT